MLKLFFSFLILSLVFFTGTQGLNTPNSKAPFFEKMKFALDLEKTMASGSTPADAANWAKGLWEFVAGAPGADENTYVYGWVRKMLVNFSDTMVGFGYADCSAIPTTGSQAYPGAPGVTVTFSVGDQTVPAGTMWENSGTTYTKKVVADLSGTDFFEVQYDCDTAKPNVYLKYDFNAFESVQRKVELYAQHDSSTDKVSMEVRMDCDDPVECSTKENLVLAMNTPDGDEFKILGTRIVDDVTDQANRMSVHGRKSIELADIHMHEGTDLTNTDDINPTLPGVDGHCVDFSTATYVPPGGATDCSTASLAAEDELPVGMTNAFSLGNYHVNNVEAFSITF